MSTIFLLIASNTFMTFAWYGHLKFRSQPLYVVVLISWCIALFEYALQVPANRIGYRTFTATQLKVLQEAISIGVFLVFAWQYFGELPSWRALVAFLLILVAVALVRSEGTKQSHEAEPIVARSGTTRPV